jgi:hypothetical protein
LVPGSSPGGPTRNENTNLRVGIFLSIVTVMDQTKITFGRGYFHKYKSLAGNNLNHALEIVETLTIYCPKPSELNDEDEFRPIFTASKLFEEGYKAEIEKWVRGCISTKGFTPTEDQIQSELKALNQERLDAIAVELSKQFYEEVNTKHRVISMTNSPCNHHLWSEYAQDYSGICFEFRMSPWLATMYEVEYVNGPKLLDLASNADYEQLKVVALTKNTKWADEEEFRMVLSVPPIDNGPALKNNRLYLLPNMLTSIYFGFKMDPMHLQILLQSIMKKVPHVSRFIVYGGIPHKDVIAVRF